jgi:putative spermidine/putrescine transport system substrate-binding protein
MTDAFQKDCLDILAGKVQRGEISRRRFAQLAALSNNWFSSTGAATR